jgi:hypothetical protein
MLEGQREMLTMRERKKATAVLAGRYQGARKKDKGQ